MKKFLSIILMLSLIMSMFCGCSIYGGGGNGYQGTTSTTAPTYLSRGEWIIMLGQEFGMTEYATQEPCYTDILGTNCEVYVRSCYDWDVLMETYDGRFNPDKIASNEFVITTAFLAAEIIDNEIGYTTEDIEHNLNFYGISDMTQTSFSSGAKLEFAKQVLEYCKGLYMVGDVMEREEVVMNEVVDLTTYSYNEITVNENQVSMPSDMASSLEVGDVFIAPPTVLDPEGVAYKVVEKTDANGQTAIVTEEPDLGDIYDSIDINKNLEIDFNDMLLAEGVEIGSNIETMSTMTMSDEENKSELELRVNFTKGKAEINKDWNDFSFDTEFFLSDLGDTHSYLPDDEREELGKLFEKSNVICEAPIAKDDLWRLDHDGELVVFETSNKFEGGYEITGGITIEDIDVNTSLKFKKIFGVPTGIQKFTATSGCTMSADLTLKGELKEELTIAKIPVVLGNGITVDLEMILYADVNGELQIKFEYYTQAKFDYEDNKFKKSQNSVCSASTEANVEVDGGVSIPRITVKAFSIKVVDVELKVGFELDSNMYYKKSHEEVVNEDSTDTTYKVEVGVDIDLYSPIVILAVGVQENTLASKLKIKGEWEIISKDNCEFHKTFDKTYTIYELTVSENNAESSVESSVPKTSVDTSQSSTTETSTSVDTQSVSYTLCKNFVDNYTASTVLSYQIADMNADGVCELILNTRQNPQDDYSNSELYAVNGDTLQLVATAWVNEMQSAPFKLVSDVNTNEIYLKLETYYNSWGRMGINTILQKYDNFQLTNQIMYEQLQSSSTTSDDTGESYGDIYYYDDQSAGWQYTFFYLNGYNVSKEEYDAEIGRYNTQEYLVNYVHVSD